MIGAARACVAKVTGAAETWYGLIDYGVGTDINDASSNRHYTIPNAAVLDKSATTGYAVGHFIELSQNAGTQAQYMVSSGLFNANPSFQMYLGEASNTPANSYFATPCDATVDNNFGSIADAVELAKTILVVEQFDPGSGNSEIWICEPGGVASMVASSAGPPGDIAAPTDWFLGTRSDLETARYFQEEMGGHFMVARNLTSNEIETLANGTSPVTLLGSDCVGAWSFAGGANATEPDVSANNNIATRRGTGWPGQVTDAISVIDSDQSHTATVAGSSVDSPQTIPVTLDASTNRKISVIVATDADTPTSVVFDAGGADEAAFTQRLTVGSFIEIWDVDIPDAVDAGTYNITATATVSEPLAWSMVAMRNAAAGAPHSTDTFGPVGGGPGTDTGVLTTVPNGALIIGGVSHAAYSGDASYVWTSAGAPIELMDGNLTGSPFFMAGAAYELVDGGDASYDFTWTATNEGATAYASYACYGPAT